MSRERWFRGDHEGQEPPFDWYGLARAHGIAVEQAQSLYEEAVRRARAGRGERRSARDIYLALIDDARLAAWQPAPGKVTRTMRLQADAAGKKRRKSHISPLTGQAIAPGKRTLTSYLEPPVRGRRGAEQASHERERLETIAGSFRAMGVSVPADLQNALARAGHSELADEARRGERAASDAAQSMAPVREPLLEHMVPGTAAHRRHEASVDALFGHFEALDALDEEEAAAGVDIEPRRTEVVSAPLTGPQELLRSVLRTAARSTGQSLPTHLRAQLERALGAELSGVRVHTSVAAGAAARAIDAVAFTTGQDIYFAPDAYDPASRIGNHLLVHEVAHAVQSRGSSLAGRPESMVQTRGAIHLGQAGDPLELEADRFASAFVRGRGDRMQLGTTGTQPVIHRREVHHEPVDVGAEDAVGEADDVHEEEGQPRPDREGGSQQDESTPDPGEIDEAAADGISGDESNEAVTAEIVGKEDGSDPVTRGAELGRTAVEEGSDSISEEETGFQPDTTDAVRQPIQGDAVDMAALEAASDATDYTVDGAGFQFADPDVSQLLPPQREGEDPAQRARLEETLHEEIEADREYATTRIGVFLASGAARAAELPPLAHETQMRIQAATGMARAAVEAAVVAQTDAIREQVAQVTARVQSETEALRARIEADHLAVVADIEASTAAGRAQLGKVLDGATRIVDSGEQAQRAQIRNLYQQAESSFRAAGQRAGALAVSEAARRAGEYRAGKIGREDSFLDGHLTDNRCEAQAEAAEKVGAAYRDELIIEAENQVRNMWSRLPEDEASVQSIAEQARKSLQGTHDGSLQGLEAAHQQSLRNAEELRSALLAGVDSALEATLAGLARHEATQIMALEARGQALIQIIEQQAQEAATQLAEATEQAAAGLTRGLQSMKASLQGTEMPLPEEVDEALAQAEAAIAAQVIQLRTGLEQTTVQVEQSIAEAGASAVHTIEQLGSAAIEAAHQSGAALSQTLLQLSESAAGSFQELQSGHDDAIASNVEGCREGLQGVAQGLRDSYARLDINLQQGLGRNAQAVDEGLTNAVREDMHGVITDEARVAYEQVQPRWKSVLKWVIIIAVVLVVAIVLGPLVVGAVTGLAAGLGASAALAGVIGTVVGGALVGAAASAATTVIDNAFSGRDLIDGLGTAILMGAVGGALGGAASMPLKALSGAMHLGASVAVDLVIDTSLNLATGNFSWETLGASLAISLLANGVSTNARVQRVQTRFTGFGHGASFRAGRNMQVRATGRGEPGSAGTIHIDSAHVHQGDTAGGGPYAGKWDMKGGGHNAAEIRARATSDGYGQKTLAMDPITGVAIDEFSRPALDNAGTPIPDASSPTGTKIKAVQKSLFPDSMGRAEIETGARTALEQALAGAPNTAHTPPSVSPTGKPINGKFSSTILTPEGHPMVVEGYYNRLPNGDIEIKTCYPATDPKNMTFPAAPGSYSPGTAGYVTPPDFSYGEESREDTPGSGLTDQGN